MFLLMLTGALHKTIITIIVSMFSETCNIDGDAFTCQSTEIPFIQPSRLSGKTSFMDAAQCVMLT